MIFDNYLKTTRDLRLLQNNRCNVAVVNQNNCSVELTTTFNTFKSEKNMKLPRLYYLVFYVSGQRPFLKVVKFNYVKKKILKRFFLKVSLNKDNKNNFLSYLICYYLYFFQIYYQGDVKYNYVNNKYILYLDNIQYFFKNYTRHAHGTQIKVIFSGSINATNPLELISNFFVVGIKEQ